jgi:4-alpha-glucanotransferase
VAGARQREPAALAEARRSPTRRLPRLQSRSPSTGEARQHRAGVRLFGDIPIFPAGDSADVWANQRIFKLDPGGRPTVVAGVPPDYFSKTGQLWGNPVYRWDVLKAEGYRWWVERFRRTFELVDLVRLDHFRGFEAAWEVPAGARTAERGVWVPGPGLELFERVEAQLGPLPIVAEDLGVITARVRRLRDATGYPGMKVLQFAFGGDPGHPFMPHNHTSRCVVYTGTHDNDYRPPAGSPRSRKPNARRCASTQESTVAAVARKPAVATTPASRALVRLAYRSWPGWRSCPCRTSSPWGARRA